MAKAQSEEMIPVGGSGAMFDRIAKRYDRMNRLLSFGMDRGWRKKLIRELGDLTEGDSVLDVATGTADVALDINKRHSSVIIKGLDPSCGMLDVGRTKVEKRGVQDKVELVVGDAQNMPFADNEFAASCIAFGIRNVPNRVLGLQEMTRVVRPGGKVVVLELSEPRGSALSWFARIHVHHVVPALGALLSGSREYRYLQKSIAAFPAPPEFAKLMEEAGLEDIKIERLTLGTAHLYTGTVSG